MRMHICETFSVGLHANRWCCDNMLCMHKPTAFSPLFLCVCKLCTYLHTCVYVHTRCEILTLIKFPQLVGAWQRSFQRRIFSFVIHVWLVRDFHRYMSINVIHWEWGNLIKDLSEIVAILGPLRTAASLSAPWSVPTYDSMGNVHGTTSGCALLKCLLLALLSKGVPLSKQFHWKHD